MKNVASRTPSHRCLSLVQLVNVKPDLVAHNVVWISVGCAVTVGICDSKCPSVMAVAPSCGCAAKVASGIAKESAWQRVADFWCQARAGSVRPDAVSMNIRLGSGPWNGALTLLRCAATISQFNTALSACEKQGKWICSLQMFSRMLARGLQPNAVTLGGLLSADAEQSWPAALGRLHATSFWFRINPGAAHYGAVMTAAARGEVWEATVRLYAGIVKTQVPLSDICVDLVIKACENAGRKDLGLIALWQSEDMPRGLEERQCRQ